MAGKTAVKRNRFIKLSGGTRTVNRALEAKARALAGLKGYVTNLDRTVAEPPSSSSAPTTGCTPSRGRSGCKHDLQAPPIYHHERESIEAHLSVVFAALAVTAGSRTPPAGRSRSSPAPPAATAPAIAVGTHTLTAADPRRPPARRPPRCLDAIHPASRHAHQLEPRRLHDTWG